MAVDVSGFPLEFSVALNLDDVKAGLAQMERSIGESVRKQVQQNQAAEKAQASYAQMILATGRAFSALDSGIQGQIKKLTTLQEELGKVKEAQAALAERKELGINGPETATSMAALVAKERELSASINQVSQDMQQSDAIMRAASGSIQQKSLQLQQLKNDYIALGEADRNSASVGGQMLTNIEKLDVELRGLNTSFQFVQQNAAGSINEKVQALAKLKDQYGALAETDRNSDIGKGMLANIHQLDAEVKVLNNSFQAVQQNAAGSLNEKVAALTRLKNEYAALSEADRKSDIGKKMRENITGLDEEVKKINGAFGETQGLVDKLTGAIAAYASLQFAGNFLKDVVEVRGQFQQLEVAFKTMLGSKEKADKLMEEVTQFAATTPFELTEVAGASKQLLAFGIDASNIKDTLRSLGDVASGIGAPLSDIAYLYGTIKTAGVANNEDIKQFAQRGIPIYEALAKVLNTNVENVKEFVTAGKVGFPQIEKAFQSLTGSGSQFGGLMEAQSKTLTGQLSNLSDAWSRMLNDIGKSGEGVFADAISSATSLVQNYETVIDVIKTVVLVYGSYRAALLATTAIQAIQKAATEGQTVAELLRTKAITASRVVMELLNKTMLANPAAVIAASIATLVGALVLLRDRTIEVTDAQKFLNDAQHDADTKFAEQEGAIKSYVEVLGNQNLAEQTRLDAYTKLKQIAPDIIGQLTFQASKTADLTVATNTYIATLRQRLDLEANQEAYKNARKQRADAFAAAEEAAKKQGGNRSETITKIQGAAQLEVTTVSEYGKAAAAFRQADKAVEDIEKRIQHSVENTAEAIQTRIDNLKKERDLFAANSDRYKGYTKDIDSLNKALADAKAKANAPIVPKRTLADIDKDIKSEKEAQNTSSNDKEYLEHQAKINKLEEERRRIVGESKKELKAEESLQSKINALLEKRSDVLRSIKDAKRDAAQTGLVKEASEIDKINEKYDDRIRKINEFNKSVDDFNKKNGTKVQKVGQLDVKSLNDARNTELGNFNLKADAEKYAKHLDELQKIFVQYEEAKTKVGEEQALRLYGKQLQGFTSYAEALKAEFAKIAPKLTLGIFNIGDALKFKSLMKAAKEEQERNADQQVKDLERLYTSTASFDQKRRQLDKAYQNDIKTLQKNFTGEDLAARTKKRTEQYGQDTKALKEQTARESDIYKLFNSDVVELTRQQIRERIKMLEQYVDTTKGLDRKTIADIKAGIASLHGLLPSSFVPTAAQEELARNLSDVKADVLLVADSFRQTADAVRETNSGLADTLDTTAKLLDIVGSGLQAAIGALSGDIKAAVSGTISYYKGIFDFVFTSPKRSAAEAQQRLEEFTRNLIAGERELNELSRQRQRDQVQGLKLTYQRIAAERQLLEDQKRAVAEQYNATLRQLQAETAVVGLTTQKKGGVFGIGAKTEVVEIRESLQGRSFADLERLFMSGQLTGRAKELFEALSKIKSEGVDIDALLEENKRKAQEIFTGTTADSIADTIADGFANGMTSAADFASSFEDMMRKALIQSLKYKYLEGPLQDFFVQFADAAQSDQTLTSTEVSQLQTMYNNIIGNAQQQFDQLQQIAGINFASGSGGGGASLTGAIKGMTETQADLLAGQFGGLRLTALDQLTAARSGLVFLQNIENNTALTAQRLQTIVDKFDRYETGARKLAVNI
jgi:hypothetical protein